MLSYLKKLLYKSSTGKCHEVRARQPDSQESRLKNVKILHNLNHTCRLNGNVHAAIDLACAQARLGYNVAVCSSGGDFDEVLSENGVKTIVINQKRNPLTLGLAVLKMTIIFRKYDIIHAHMVTSAMLSLPACMLTGTPLITTIHNSFEKSAIIMGVGRRVIAVSAAVGRSMLQRGISKKRLRVVLNGTIGTARFKTATVPKVKNGSTSVLYVGGLHPRKGVKNLIEAFDRSYNANKNLTLTIVGEGPYQQQYIDKLQSRHCRLAVQFVGSQVNPWPYFATSDIFVLPSLADPAPLVLCEARQAGCAIIASDVDGIPELLEDGKAGILVKPNDTKSLSDAMLLLADCSQTLALWKSNSQINIEKLTVDRVARETLSVYFEAIKI